MIFIVIIWWDNKSDAEAPFMKFEEYEVVLQTIENYQLQNWQTEQICK